MTSTGVAQLLAPTLDDGGAFLCLHGSLVLTEAAIGEPRPPSMGRTRGHARGHGAGPSWARASSVWSWRLPPVGWCGGVRPARSATR
jgi:hypothetical protein